MQTGVFQARIQACLLSQWMPSIGKLPPWHPVFQRMLSTGCADSMHGGIDVIGCCIHIGGLMPITDGPSTQWVHVQPLKATCRPLHSVPLPTGWLRVCRVKADHNSQCISLPHAFARSSSRLGRPY